MKATKEYTMSKMGVINAPEANVTITFKGDKIYDGPLGGIGAWIKANKPGTITGATSDGCKHGVFPCIVAAGPRMSAALSVLAGYRVAVGDGRCYWDRAQARRDYDQLVRLGIPVPKEALIWGITEVPYGTITVSKEPVQPESIEETSAAIFG